MIAYGTTTRLFFSVERFISPGLGKAQIIAIIGGLADPGDPGSKLRVCDSVTENVIVETRSNLVATHSLLMEVIELMLMRAAFVATGSTSQSGHDFSCQPTNEFGIHSGRRRYLVKCVTCSEVLHEATTGPFEQITYHLRGLR